MKNIEKFKKELYDRNSDKFWLFCGIHINLLMRKEDDADFLIDEDTGAWCDFPGCPQLATKEFFPNLVTIFQEANKRD